MTRSRFLDEMGIPKTDFRKKYKCYGCGKPITKDNYYCIEEVSQKAICQECAKDSDKFIKMVFGNKEV